VQDRGLLRPGLYADITIFDADKVIDRATYTEPFQYSVGIEYVVVNGQVVLDRGKHTGAMPGKALRIRQFDSANRWLSRRHGPSGERGEPEVPGARFAREGQRQNALGRDQPRACTTPIPAVHDDRGSGRDERNDERTAGRTGGVDAHPQPAGRAPAFRIYAIPAELRETSFRFRRSRRIARSTRQIPAHEQRVAVLEPARGQPVEGRSRRDCVAADERAAADVMLDHTFDERTKQGGYGTMDADVWLYCDPATQPSAGSVVPTPSI